MEQSTERVGQVCPVLGSWSAGSELVWYQFHSLSAPFYWSTSPGGALPLIYSKDTDIKAITCKKRKSISEPLIPLLSASQRHSQTVFVCFVLVSPFWWCRSEMFWHNITPKPYKFVLWKAQWKKPISSELVHENKVICSLLHINIKFKRSKP